MNQKGEGFSKYKNIYINYFKNTDDYVQGILFYIKSIKNKNIISSSYSQNLKNGNQYQYGTLKVNYHCAQLTLILLLNGQKRICPLNLGKRVLHTQIKLYQKLLHKLTSKSN